jgi:hypothetical protein
MTGHAVITLDDREISVEVEYDYQPAERPQRDSWGGWLYPGCSASVDVTGIREDLDVHGPCREWDPIMLPDEIVERLEQEIAEQEGEDDASETI